MLGFFYWSYKIVKIELFLSYWLDKRNNRYQGIFKSRIKVNRNPYGKKTKLDEKTYTWLIVGCLAFKG